MAYICGMICSLCRFVVAAAVALLAACSQSPGEGRVGHLPSSKGLPYEMVVIVPKAMYAGELRDTLEAVLQGSTPVLPQHEPLFRLNIVYAEGNLTPWRTFRHRLLIGVDRKRRKPMMGVAVDAVARPQLEVKVTAASAHELAVFMGQQKERLRDLFVESELEVTAANLRRKPSAATSKALVGLTRSMAARGELSGSHDICVPAGLKASKTGDGFLWTGTNLNDKDQNFLFYTYVWEGRSFSVARFVAARDSVLKEFIPGARADQWMQTARMEEPLVFARTRAVNNKVVLEVHGLWELHNGALGGPFVALCRVDTLARRVMVTEGFVYSPHSPKRNLMREMEAALRTFE